MHTQDTATDRPGAYIVRYPSDDDAGRNVGPFNSERSARAYAAAHPVAGEEWQPYVVRLVEPDSDLVRAGLYSTQQHDAYVRQGSGEIVYVAKERREDLTIYAIGVTYLIDAESPEAAMDVAATAFAHDDRFRHASGAYLLGNADPESLEAPVVDCGAGPLVMA